jgi:8-oxo-dGTP diphosphatase
MAFLLRSIATAMPCRKKSHSLLATFTCAFKEDFEVGSRISARAIVIHDNKLLVMRRDKFGSKYVTLPGGKVEIGEQPDQTAVREVSEETMVAVQNPRLVFVDHADFYGDQMVYLCDYVSGEPTLGPNTTEAAIHKMGKNLYEPAWLPLSELPSVPFLSAELQQAIIQATTAGWPDHVQEFSSVRNVK